MKKDKREGFTLIEMLIVIAIIGILASIVLVGLGPIQRQGRDSRRQTDLRQVQNALELYFNRCSHYPGGASCDDGIGSPDWNELSDALTGARIGVSQIPNDPSSNGGEIADRNYEYATDGDGTTYVLKAQLEDNENPALRDSLTNDDLPDGISGISCDPSDGEYCLAL